MKKIEGGYTETAKETLELLLQSHFPGSKTLTKNDAGEPITLEPLLRGNRGDWVLARQIVNLTKVRWAVKTFHPYKSPGMDGIFSALLQQGLNLIASTLCALLRASIALGYIPMVWRDVKVVFILKPGRDSCAQAKSFRPISLTSFLLKLLEKLIDRHIRN